MRPTADELLVGMKSVLDNVIAPELTSAWATAMAGQMGAILEHLCGRPEREKAYIASQNAELRTLIRIAMGYFGKNKELDAAVDGPQMNLLRELARQEPSAAEEAGRTVESLAQENEALREGLVWAIESLNAAGGHKAAELGTTKLGIREGLKKMLEDDRLFWRPIGLGARPARA